MHTLKRMSELVWYTADEVTEEKDGERYVRNSTIRSFPDRRECDK